MDVPHSTVSHSHSNNDGKKFNGSENEFVELTQRLQLCDANKTKAVPTTIEENNDENNQNRVNSVHGMQGQKYQASTAAGPSKQSTKPTSTVRAYDVAEVYRQRKEYKMKKVKEEEERLRKHKAKPMPNFRAIHLKANSASKMSVEDVVSPETPQVLRRGLAMKEKQKQKIKEHEIKLAERPSIVAKSTKVLQEKPFKPKLEPHRPLKVEPFKLQMDERLEQRRQYDENYQRELAIKKQKEQEKKEAEENLQRQLARKDTVFTARANPFKKS